MFFFLSISGTIMCVCVCVCMCVILKLLHSFFFCYSFLQEHIFLQKFEQQCVSYSSIIQTLDK